MTKIIPCNKPTALKSAMDRLIQGDIIALPTDTVYGLAALAFNTTAVAQIYKVKARPNDKAIPVFIASVDQLDEVCQQVPTQILPWLNKHWPGALTIILPAAPTLPGIVTNHQPTVAVRIPNHAFVLDLLRGINQPLAVTSANISGEEPALNAYQVEAQFGDSVPLILDDGPSPGNKPSTIVDLTQTPPCILREGVLKLGDLYRPT